MAALTLPGPTSASFTPLSAFTGAWSAQIDPTLGTQLCWIYLLDAVSLPSDGDVSAIMLDTCEVSHTAGTPDSVVGTLDFTWLVNKGATVVISSTGYTRGGWQLTTLAGGLSWAQIVEPGD